MRDSLDPKMLDSSDSVIGKNAAGKLQAAVMKTIKKAMAYLALAFENMKLLRLVTKAMSVNMHLHKPSPRLLRLV